MNMTSTRPMMISGSSRFNRPPRNNMYKPGDSFSFPVKSKPISIPKENKSSDTKSSDSTPTKEYKSFKEMKKELSDKEIHLQFAIIILFSNIFIVIRDEERIIRQGNSFAIRKTFIKFVERRY